MINNIRNAFEKSTPSLNLFEMAITSIKWDNYYFADSEYYFTKGGVIFTTPSLNPFEISKDWRPAFLTSDGSYIEL